MRDGVALGFTDGFDDGELPGTRDGAALGVTDGFDDGELLGARDGATLGVTDIFDEGERERELLGVEDGFIVDVGE